MKLKRFFVFLLVILISSLCVLSYHSYVDIKQQEKIIKELKAYNAGVRKYRSINLGDDTKLDVYVKKGEKLLDITLLTAESRCVQVQFTTNDKNLSRVYCIYFNEGERIKKWSESFILTSKRSLKLNFIYE